MKTVFKYDISRGEVELPEGAEIRSVGAQEGCLFLWAEIDTNRPTRSRQIEIFATGEPLPQDTEISREFLGTVFEGPYVWHVYERK